MVAQLGYGMLGCGMMGQEHIRNLMLTGASVDVVVEPDPRMRERILLLIPNVRFVDSLDALLACRELDALVIATPNYQHGDQLLEIFAHSSLPILVEKPLITRPDQIEVIRQAAAEYSAPVWVGMEYRFMPPMQDFRQQLIAGAIGDLKMLSIREHRFPFLKKVNDWNRFNRNSGGTLVEKCCHFFDLMRLITEDEPIRVMASAGQDVNHLKEEYGGEVPDILDNAFVIVDFESGKRALLDLSMFAQGSRYEQEVCAVGHRGKLECLIPGPEILWQDQQAAPRVVLSPRSPLGPIDKEIAIDDAVLDAGTHSGSTYFEHLAFQKAIRGEGKVEVSVEDGLRAVVMGMAAQESAARGQAVLIADEGFGIES